MPDNAYVIAAAPVLAVMLLVAMLLVSAALHRRGLLTPWRLLTAGAVAVYLEALLTATMFPLRVDVGPLAPPPQHWPDTLNFVPLVTAQPGGMLLNIAMTIPLGLLAPLVIRVRSVGTAALVGVTVSTTIELLQLAGNIVFSTGRTTDINDVIANTLGAVLGWVLLRSFARLSWSRRGLRAMSLHRLRRPVASSA